jgi:hypothetical protein
MLWRVWKWGERKVEAVRDFVARDEKDQQSTDNSTAEEQGETS